METTLSCCARRRVCVIRNKPPPSAAEPPHRPAHPEQDSISSPPRPASKGVPCPSAPNCSPSLIPTLPGHSYTDPTIFAQERRGSSRRSGSPPARTSDLDGPGSFRTVDVGRESVLIVRGRDKKLRAFLNVCRHRGARVCMEESGTGQRKLQCPYHAWTYDLDGQLIAAPNLTKMPDVDRTQYGLIPRPPAGVARLRLGVPGRRAAVVRGHRDRRGRRAARRRRRRSTATTSTSSSVGRRIVYDVKANWKLIVENFMECYHCATIHPELTEVLPEFADGYAAQYYVGHGAEFGDERPGLHRRRLARASTASRASPRTRTAATTRSRSSRRSSSTWCPTT